MSTPGGSLFDGLHFCVTGAMSMEREELHQIIEAHGGKCYTSAAKHVNVLLASQAEFLANSTKCKAARKNGIPILTEDWVKDCITKNQIFAMAPYARWIPPTMVSGAAPTPVSPLSNTSDLNSGGSFLSGTSAPDSTNSVGSTLSTPGTVNTDQYLASIDQVYGLCLQAFLMGQLDADSIKFLQDSLPKAHQRSPESKKLLAGLKQRPTSAEEAEKMAVGINDAYGELRLAVRAAQLLSVPSTPLSSSGTGGDSQPSSQQSRQLTPPPISTTGYKSVVKEDPVLTRAMQSVNVGDAPTPEMIGDPVYQFLLAQNLPRYYALFQAHEVDIDTLLYMREKELRDLGIDAVGPRTRLRNALHELAIEAKRQPQLIPSLIAQARQAGERARKDLELFRAQQQIQDDKVAAEPMSSPPPPPSFSIYGDDAPSTSGAPKPPTTLTPPPTSSQQPPQHRPHTVSPLSVQQSQPQFPPSAIAPPPPLPSSQPQTQQQQSQPQQPGPVFPAEPVSEIPVEFLNEEWAIPHQELTIDKKIGSGFFGIVYKGMWQGQGVAVKKIYRAMPQGEMEMFAREIRILASLRSPYIVLFMGVCVAPNDIYLLTEFMERGSLNDVLMDKKQELTLTRRVDMMRDIARGMQYLHNRRPPIIHRDLTSMNILVDSSFHCKVADFGMSRIKDTAVQMTRQPGNLRWMAPEVMLRQDYDERADVYSFGLVMWEILFRNIPLPELQPQQAAAEMAYRQVRPFVPNPCDWPQELLGLMRACWSQEPADRPLFAIIVQQLELFAKKLQQQQQ